MGSVKEYYHEELMRNAQRWVSEISFICPACGHQVRLEVDVPEPNYAGEKSSEMVSEGEVDFSCSNCGQYFEGDVWAGPAHCDITLREYPDTVVSCDPPGYDRPPEDWDDDWEIPDDPVVVFKANIAELSELIENQAQDNGSSLINRMIFAQVLTFLEAYFCDTLIQGLRQRPDLLADFAGRDGSIAQTAFSASAILRDPDYVKKTVEHNLKSRLYHQFGSGRSCRECGGNWRAARSEHVTLAPVRPRGQGTSAREAEKGFPSHRPFASGSGLRPRAPKAASARFPHRAARSGS